ncbi:hypothetical protein J437_LFUL008276 [Ladona fulva]|uniref:Uncharacterized protein n=1 Tax=Ladona fulva TaxID=123851 RepID=A0A8K0K598_LADFU|nr:hypothetical protein J437_LFUL008276 [Ladona fulva]
MKVLWRGRLFFKHHIKGKWHKYGVLLCIKMLSNVLVPRVRDNNIEDDNHTKKVVKQ